MFRGNLYLFGQYAAQWKATDDQKREELEGRQERMDEMGEGK